MGHGPCTKREFNRRLEGSPLYNTQPGCLKDASKTTLRRKWWGVIGGFDVCNLEEAGTETRFFQKYCKIKNQDLLDDAEY